MIDPTKHGRVVLFAAFALTAAAAHAELSVDPNGSRVNTLIVGIITDDSDPIGRAWEPFRPIPSERILNPAGHLRTDGRPDISYAAAIVGAPDPVTVQWPVVVWSYRTGNDHDVATAEWTGTAWSAIEFLTATTEEDLDPRIFIEAGGTRHVVWWTAGATERVFLRSREAGSETWTAAVEVAVGARRPSVAVFGGTLRVAFERDTAAPEMSRDVVVLRQETGGAFVEEFVLSTARTERLDAVLHARGSKLWLDWKHGQQVFGSARFVDGAWGGVNEPAWPCSSWVGVEDTRKAIGNAVLSD